MADVGEGGNAEGACIVGASQGDSAGWASAGAGDVNGDGSADVLVGAYRTDSNGSDSGSAYVVWDQPPLLDSLNAFLP